MRDSPAMMSVYVVLFILGASALAAFVKSRNQPVYPATPKLVAADPDFWFEKSIKLKTSSLEVFIDAQGARELRYRELTDRPFCVVVRGRIPDPIPDDLLCFCEGTKDGITVLICR